MTVPTFGRPTATRSNSASLARGIVAAVMIAAGVGGFLATDATAAARAVFSAGSDLTRLLRAMAAIKAVIGAGAATAVFWRLSLPVSAPRLALYAASGAAMAAGPVLIWNIADVAAGALLLHAGLAMTVIMLWRDPAVSRRLSRLIADRRASQGAQRIARSTDALTSHQMQWSRHGSAMQPLPLRKRLDEKTMSGKR